MKLYTVKRNRFKDKPCRFTLIELLVRTTC